MKTKFEILAASQDFEPSEGHIWLNCAHQGPMPRIAAEEAREAIFWKTALHHLKDELDSRSKARFMAVESLKEGGESEKAYITL